VNSYYYVTRDDDDDDNDSDVYGGVGLYP